MGSIALVVEACSKTDAGWTLKAWRHGLGDDCEVMRLAPLAGAKRPAQPQPVAVITGAVLGRPHPSALVIWDAITTSSDGSW